LAHATHRQGILTVTLRCEFLDVSLRVQAGIRAIQIKGWGAPALPKKYLFIGQVVEFLGK